MSSARGKEILERLGSARFFCKLNFSAIFFSLSHTKESARNFDLSNIRADPSRSNIFDQFFPQN